MSQIFLHILLLTLFRARRTPLRNCRSPPHRRRGGFGVSPLRRCCASFLFPIPPPFEEPKESGHCTWCTMHAMHTSITETPKPLRLPDFYARRQRAAAFARPVASSKKRAGTHQKRVSLCVLLPLAPPAWSERRRTFASVRRGRLPGTMSVNRSVTD
jgi:hypothetical protein